MTCRILFGFLFSREGFRYRRTLAEMAPSHLACISNWDEICGIINSHGEYVIDGSTAEDYNWVAIEQEIHAKYIGNKPFFDLSTGDILSYTYADDFNLLNQMQKIKQTQVGGIVQMPEQHFSGQFT